MIDACERTEVSLVGRGGGLACGPDNACLRIPRMALFSQLAIKVSRTKATPMLSMPYQAISKVYGFEPLNLRLIDPARVELPISRATIELDRVTILRTSDLRNNSWTPLGTEVDIATATATVSSLGYFVAALGPRRVVGRDGGMGTMTDIAIPDDQAAPIEPPTPVAAPARTGPEHDDIT
jgi:hypothetical protein